MALEGFAGADIRHRPNRRSRGAIVLAALLLWAGSGRLGRAAPSPGCSRSSDGAESCAYAGRPLVEVLGDLRALGLNLIFSSDLVRPDMVVGSEPPVATPRRILDRLLAPFGLEARDGPAGIILIVRAAGASGGEGDPAAAAGDRHETRAAPAPFALREWVKVAASSEDEPGRRTDLSRDGIERLPAVGDDPNRTIAWLPGIASADRSAQISIRGGGEDGALVVLDGLQIDEPFHLQSFLAFSSIVDARAIGRVDVRTGIFPAEYGERASGVIDLSTADPAGAQRTTVGLSLINASALTEGTLGDNRGSWLVSARSWRPGAVLDAVELGGEEIDPSYSDLLGKVQFQLPGGSLLSAHVLASRDDLQYRADLGGGRVDADENHRYAWITLKTPWSSRLYSQTLAWSDQVGRSRDGSTADAADVVARVHDVRSDSSVGLKQDWIFAAAERWSLKWGFDARWLEGEYDYRSHGVATTPFAGGGLSGGADVLLANTTPPGAPAPSGFDRDVTLDPSGVDLGAYVSGRFQVLAPLTLEAGLRRDRQSLTDQAETSPRVALALTLGERSVLRTGWGRFHQPEGINELEVEDGVSRFFPAERVDQWEVGLDHLFAGGLKLGVAAYFKDMTRLRPRYENLFNPFQIFPESEPDRVRVAAGRAIARGVEIALARDRGGPWSWRLSYARAAAEDRLEDGWVPRSWDQPHTFNFSLNYRRGGRWDVSLAGVYHTGWPTTEVRAEQVRNPDGSFSVQPVLGPYNALRYPPYHRLDLKVTRLFRVRGGTMGLHLDITNLYDRGNVCCADGFQFLPQPDGTVRVKRTDGYWLQRLPVVGLTWDF